MTLVEVMVAVVILTVSVYLLSSTITAAIAHSDVKRERTLAVEAAINLIERMHSEPFEELFASYNDDPADDPLGVGTGPGPNFAVPGLDPQPADADGFVGEVVLPQGPAPEPEEGPAEPGPGPAPGGKGSPGSSTAVALREDLALPGLDMPRDLNGDVIIDGEDHAEDYLVLPVIVRVAWDGKGGRRFIEIPTMFAKLEKLEE